MVKLMVKLAGYEIAEQIYAGSRTAVYRALRQSDRQRVVIKQLYNPYPTFSELLLFRNQYTIAKNLHIPGIVRPYSLESSGNSYVLVMEDCGGISLNRLPSQFKPLKIEDVLFLGIKLADILHELHQNRVIHKDIKPANILINPESKQVKLIDFSIASLLPKETQEIANPNILEGTLAYISPEQTGRMNRGIDYRSDFYSFGVTLFELLAGQLPFTPIEPMELLHCHIAKIPPRLDEFTERNSHTKIPTVLAEIVMKLMAKNAENRYQSALGLKHDLEKCLVQIQETGTIKKFEIAQRDASDRFLISEKLYGRTSEVKTLLDAFDRVANPPQPTLAKGGRSEVVPPLSQKGVGGVELVLVAGFSGIGKTAVINEVHKPIVRQRGYFIKGKFDQFNRNIPLSAFVQALRDLMQQLLSESDAKIAGWKAQILSAVGENGQVLIDVIPELEQIIGKQPTAPELSGAAAQNRFNLLFQKFLEVFTTAEHPLVLFLDDLQWADLASLKLLKLLVNDRGYLLVLGAYRDNEVSPAHPFILTVEELKKAGATVNTITLAPLDFDDTNQMIADTLNCSRELAQPLTKLVDRKTRGNPFFTTQFLKALYEDGYIRFDRDRRYWECDITQVNALSLTDDVVEFMTWQLQKLPAATQQVLKLAACVGDRFDLATLAIVSQQSPTEAATALWKALQEGLILPTSQVYKFFHGTEQFKTENTANSTYRFLHDRVQQAAYSLIPEDRKQATHLQIGQLLLHGVSLAEKDAKVFDIVEHLNLGATLLTQAEERDKLAQLNLLAHQRAKASAAFVAALEYASIGIELLEVNCWQCQYNLARSLYEAAAEAAYLAGNFKQMEQSIEIVLQNTRTLLDRIKVYQLKIQFFIAHNQMQQAVDIGLQTIEKLGFNLATQHSNTSSIIVLPQLVDLETATEMADSTYLAIMRLLADIISPAYFGVPDVFTQIPLTMIDISIEQGHSEMSASGYGFGALLFLRTGDFNRGYHSGLSSLKLLDRFDKKDKKCQLYLIFNVFIRPHKEHGRESLQPLLEGFHLGLETGDIEYASYCAMNYCNHLFFTGESLESAKHLQSPYLEQILKFKLNFSINFSHIWRQIVLNIIGEVDNPTVLVGEAFDETIAISHLKETSSFTLLFSTYVAKAILFYLFGNYTESVDSALSARQYINSEFAPLMCGSHHFYYSLALLAESSQTESQSESLTIVEENQRIMRVWAIHAPMNFQHKYELVEAEKHRVFGNYAEAIDLYDRAISGAKENGYIQEEALANELAAKFYLDWGKEKVASGYMQEAYYCYAKWGAKAKTDDLEKRYPQLLQPILQQASQPLTVLETLASITTTAHSVHSTHSKSSSSTSLNNTLDFAALLKVSQALSSTIQLDELIQTLTQTMLENSGADKCALMLCQDEQWLVRAISDLQQTTLQTVPLEDNPSLPVQLIYYVKNTLETIVLDNLKTELPVAIDPYLQQHQPQSVLCLPILDRGNLAGILYLENRSTRAVFTSDRLIVLNFLASQAAIALENARLYGQVQQTLEELQQAQLQMVQSEKMSALGNLVAGVAHEINNPIGCIVGNVNAAQDYINDLLNLIDLYGEEVPQPSAKIEEELEAIDLDYVREDLPKLIRAMKDGGSRITSISKSLCTFSRADSDAKQPFNLHEGIDSTILILRHRLKANENRPAIEVVTDYGNLPEIACFPGQLNQVFMNILANAIDAIDESNLGRIFADIEANPNRITIQTTVENERVKIAIADNGPGIPEEVKSHIFDHLFTTKTVGKGTGLGLAIARQIVVQKHGGAIEVNSQLGQGTEFILTLPLN